MGWFDKFINRFRRKGVHLQKHPDVRLLAIASDVASPTKPSKTAVTPGLVKNPDIQNIKTRGLSYFVQPGQKDWVYPQYDHFEVEMVYDIESYAARALRAKLALFLKEGYEFVGRNEERIKYVRERFRQFAFATCIPTDVLLYQTCRDLSAHSNAFWLKVRNTKASGGMERFIGKKRVQPIAGLFPLPPETMVPELDGTGTILRWKQVIGVEERIFSTDDIVHFYTNKKDGYPLGIPSIWASIDDIRALRNLEANVEALMQKHLFPVFLWKVGTVEHPADTYADGRTEMEVIQEKIMDMPTEGSLVVSERYDVKTIGAENKALSVEGYLDHFLRRVLAGLDVSSIDVGIGSTSTRSTAQTLSRNLMDTVKLHQITIEKFLEAFITELLLESTFADAALLSNDNIVHLRFLEIDKEAKIANANHVVDLFDKNVLTHAETRISIGREPLTEEEEEGLRWNKLGREEALIRAGDETLVTKSSPSGSTTSTTSKSNKAVTNKSKPQNQYGTRPAPKLNRDSYVAGNNISMNPILRWHLLLADELQQQWALGHLNLSSIESDVRFTYETAEREFVAILRSLIRNQYRDLEHIHGIYKAAETHLASSLKRLERELISQLKSSKESPTVIFESFRWRIVLIHETERAWATNFAGYKWFQKLRLDMQVVSNENCCDDCKSKLTIIKWDDKLGETKLPPHHPLCGCYIEAVRR